MNKICLLICLTLSCFVFAACGKSQEEIQKEARFELEKMNVPFSESEFIQAILDQKINTLELFLKAGMKAGAKFQESSIYKDLTPLLLACMFDKLDTVKCLIKNGADVNEEVADFSEVAKSLPPDSSFWNTLGSEDEEQLRRIFGRMYWGLNVNSEARNLGKISPAIVAAGNGNPEILQEIISAGGKVDSTFRFSIPRTILGKKGNSKTVTVDVGLPQFVGWSSALWQQPEVNVFGEKWAKFLSVRFRPDRIFSVLQKVVEHGGIFAPNPQLASEANYQVDFLAKGGVALCDKALCDKLVQGIPEKGVSFFSTRLFEEFWADKCYRNQGVLIGGLEMYNRTFPSLAVHMT